MAVESLCIVVKNKFYDDASASALHLIVSQIANLFSSKIFLIKNIPIYICSIFWNVGMNLKKAQERKLNEKKDEKQGMDVASILARRIAVELSDSDDDDGSDDGSGWSSGS